MKHDFNELRLAGVTRRFAAAGGQAFNALDALHLTVRRGEFIALLGPSGCGKSTALNCIAGLLPLSAGTIHLDEQRIDNLPPERRGFGMVFQNYALFPHMSVARNVGFGLRMRGVPQSEIAPRVTQVLAMVQLAGQAHKLPGQLSGGQQQRVAIARAIVIEPPLILMDEPLSNLDAKLRLETRSEIRRIHRDLGRATIYVTHDQDEALSLADRIVVMKDGVVQQVGTPQQVYGEPANLHVARFMGYRNVVPVGVTGTAGERVTVTAPDFTLTGQAMQPLGTSAMLAVRPDDWVVTASANAGAGAAAANTFSAQVDSVEYAGRESLVDVVTSSGTRLIVRTALPVQAGERVSVHVPPERALVYPE
jgi:putative spermidine/putrescine transport system ATP-binding protein